jgi:acyl-CoA synthetase (AMP-forming)/AMP-acid ligase II
LSLVDGSSSDINSTVKNNRVSLYYFFEESVQRKPNDECIWSRDGCYTWQQTYDQVHRFSQWFLQQGVKPGDLVSFYLTNSAEFVIAWLGLWAIGAAPAMINYNLTGKALIHCLKVSGAKLLLVDEDLELVARVEDEREDIEGHLGMRICVLDAEAKREIRGMTAERPNDSFRKVVKGDWPMTIFYTRQVY